MKKNDIVRVRIESLSNDGNGVSHLDGIPVFVPYSAIGDYLVVRIERVEKSYCYGRIVEIIDPSPDRIPADCDLFEKCGGCSFRHITYESELKAKQQFVKDCINRIGKIDHTVNPILHAENTDFYRNKAQYPIGSIDSVLVPGFYAPRSHRLLQFPAPCKLQPEQFHDIANDICRVLSKYHISAYDEIAHEGIARHLLIRQSSVDSSVLVCLVINSPSLPHSEEIVQEIADSHKEIKSFSISVNRNKGNTILSPEIHILFGTSAIYDEILGVPVEVTPLSFFQINHSATELLYSYIKKLIDQNSNCQTIFDLYCGAGTIGLSASSAKQVLYGIEIVEDAIKSAVSSSIRMKRDNAHFILGDAKKITSLIDQDIHPDVIITDPPRKGCSVEVLDQLVRSKSRYLIMVSCNPATLARDLFYLSQEGYIVKTIQPFDLFPRTKHVETVVCLSQQKPDDHIEIEIDLDEIDATSAETKATYKEIQNWVQEHHGFHVTNLNIAQVKQKHGIIERENYNKAKSADSKQPGCPEEKVKAIEDAMRHFQMIP